MLPVTCCEAAKNGRPAIDGLNVGVALDEIERGNREVAGECRQIGLVRRIIGLTLSFDDVLVCRCNGNHPGYSEDHPEERQCIAQRSSA